MEPEYQNGSVALIRETVLITMEQFMQLFELKQTFIKKVYREENGLRLVSINKDYKRYSNPYDETLVS